MVSQSPLSVLRFLTHEYAECYLTHIQVLFHLLRAARKLVKLDIAYRAQSTAFSKYPAKAVPTTMIKVLYISHVTARYIYWAMCLRAYCCPKDSPLIK